MNDSHQKSTTSQFFQALRETYHLDTFFQANSGMVDFPEFSDYLGEICNEKGLIPEHVVLAAGIERTYGHQLFNGTRKPSRDKVIQLAFGLGLDVEQTQKLLQAAGRSTLYPKIKRDAAIVFCLYHQKDFYETQDILYQLGVSPLGSISG
ncbi:MAG: helix-turn-helix transcriptional regulator [Anaerolineae bacterium]|nr:helix-turn-helix transcriptional regulator [Anaerolineae bacterium]